MKIELGVNDSGDFCNFESWCTFTISLQYPCTFLKVHLCLCCNRSIYISSNSWGRDQSSATAGVLSLSAVSQPELGSWVSVSSTCRSIWVYSSSIWSNRVCCNNLGWSTIGCICNFSITTPPFLCCTFNVYKSCCRTSCYCSNLRKT